MSFYIQVTQNEGGGDKKHVYNFGAEFSALGQTRFLTVDTWNAIEDGT
jgi:hypothetical protein